MRFNFNQAPPCCRAGEDDNGESNIFSVHRHTIKLEGCELMSVQPEDNIEVWEHTNGRAVRPVVVLSLTEVGLWHTTSVSTWCAFVGPAGLTQ